MAATAVLKNLNKLTNDKRNSNKTTGYEIHNLLTLERTQVCAVYHFHAQHRKKRHRLVRWIRDIVNLETGTGCAVTVAVAMELLDSHIDRVAQKAREEEDIPTIEMSFYAYEFASLQNRALACLALTRHPGHHKPTSLTILTLLKYAVGATMQHLLDIKEDIVESLKGQFPLSALTFVYRVCALLPPFENGQLRELMRLSEIQVLNRTMDMFQPSMYRSDVAVMALNTAINQTEGLSAHLRRTCKAIMWSALNKLDLSDNVELNDE